MISERVLPKKVEGRDEDTSALGVGFPGAAYLEAYGELVSDVFGQNVYAVGSAAKGKSWRDVDVVAIIPDKRFRVLFPEPRELRTLPHTRWSVVCMAFSALGQQMTGLPIDFKVQPVTEANERHKGPRIPLFLDIHKIDWRHTGE